MVLVLLGSGEGVYPGGFRVGRAMSGLCDRPSTSVGQVSIGSRLYAEIGEELGASRCHNDGQPSAATPKTFSF